MVCVVQYQQDSWSLKSTSYNIKTHIHSLHSIIGLQVWVIFKLSMAAPEVKDARP